MSDSVWLHLSCFSASLLAAASSVARPSAAFDKALRNDAEARVHVAAVKMV